MTIKIATRVASAVALCLYAAGTWAQSSLEAVQACTAEANDAKRLACYDRAAGRHAIPPKPAATPAEVFGAEAAARRKAAEASVTPETAGLEKLEARVTRVSQSKNGVFVFELDNGQRWEQVEVKTNAVINTGEAVTISRGSLRSFWMTASSKRGLRVRRIH